MGALKSVALFSITSPTCAVPFVSVSFSRVCNNQ